MPLEIHMGMAFQGADTTPYSDSSTDSEVDVDPFDDQQLDDQNFFFQTPPQPPLLLKYRSQHGLESLWWVALYILIYRVDHPAGKVLSDKIFMSTSSPTMARRELFEHRGAVLRELEEHLHPALRHKLIMESMNAIPRILFNSYFLDEPVDPKAMRKLYRRFFRNLAILVLTIKTKVGNVEFCPPHHVQPKKRSRPETSSKSRDDDEYKEGEEEEGEEPSSDDALQKRRKNSRTSAGVCR
jgi:hypothetical protein